jgi:hypothetical protein
MCDLGAEGILVNPGVDVVDKELLDNIGNLNNIYVDLIY